MGLFEKAKSICDADLRALLDSSSLPEDLLKRYILELEAYRRELALSVSTHSKESEYYEARINERLATLALWRSRTSLARTRQREPLAQAAEERAAQELAAYDELERKRDVLKSTIANLKVNLDKVERVLRAMRERKRCSSGVLRISSEQGAQLAAAVNGGASASAQAGSQPSTDPVEEEFRRLENEEVAEHLAKLRRILREIGGGPCPGDPGSGRYPAFGATPAPAPRPSAPPGPSPPTSPGGASPAPVPKPQEPNRNGRSPGRLGPGGGLGGGSPGSGTGG